MVHVAAWFIEKKKERFKQIIATVDPEGAKALLSENVLDVLGLFVPISALLKNLCNNMSSVNNSSLVEGT